MILSTKGRYAVMAMVDLANQPTGKPITLAAIAERQEIPLAYLEQIFARLKRCGLVDALRGPGGGYKLARAASETLISDIVLAADEAIKMTRCEGAGTPGCMAPKTRCLTHDLWDGLGQQIFSFLHAISLEDVLKRRVHEKFPSQHPVMHTDALYAASANA
jgi:Rrf2 family iron-sulfur cluster assembly transcriptional regulator